jgi:hypothetical protein
VAIAPKKGILQHISGVALGVKSSSDCEAFDFLAGEGSGFLLD